VYCALRSGAAELHFAIRDSKPCGILVTERRQDYDGPILFVWIAYSRNGPDVIAAGMEYLKELARSFARRIVFASPRPGWDRAAGKLGFSKSSTLWELSL
jgi:hypothetical protein